MKLSFRYFTFWFNHLARGFNPQYVSLNDKFNYLKTLEIIRATGNLKLDSDKPNSYILSIYRNYGKHN